MFNIKEDPYEQKELIRTGEFTEIYTELKDMLIEHVRQYSPDLIKDGKLNPGPAISGPEDVNKWPGFHSTIEPTDVLH